MNKSNNKSDFISKQTNGKTNKKEAQNNLEEASKGPLSFLSGSLTSAFFAWISLIISTRLILYFSNHTASYSSPFAQSIASGFKTLVIGISFLATFTFSFIGLGLFLVFIKSLFTGKNEKL